MSTSWPITAAGSMTAVGWMPAGLFVAFAESVIGLVVCGSKAQPYGAAFGGLAALLGMLNSCGSGVLVTNIDNGYGAGVAAAKINRLALEPGSV